MDDRQLELSAEKAFELATKYQEKAEHCIHTAVVLALIIIGFKLLGLSAELSLSGAKLRIEDIAALTGILGWVMAYYMLDAITYQNSARYVSRSYPDANQKLFRGVRAYRLLWMGLWVPVMGAMVVALFLAFGLALTDMKNVVVLAFSALQQIWQS